MLLHTRLFPAVTHTLFRRNLVDSTAGYYCIISPTSYSGQNRTALVDDLLWNALEGAAESRRYALRHLAQLFHHIVLWMALSDCLISQPEVAKQSLSQQYALYCLFCVLLGKRLVDTRYEPHSGNLCLLCQCWYIEST
jgi:hypothetical protein